LVVLADVIEEDARSALYALLEGAAALSIKRDELGGMLHQSGYHQRLTATTEAA